MPSTHQQSLQQRLQTLADLPLDQAHTLDPSFYTDDHWLLHEQHHLFENQWLCAGRSMDIANPGDYLCYDLGDQPIVLIRQQDQEIKAFANVCKHRMMTLLSGRGTCERQRIVCPYHAWTYDIEGDLTVAPHMNRNRDFDAKQHSLSAIRCEQWQGFLYVTLNKELPAVADMLAELTPVLANYAMADYVNIAQSDHVWQCNWKLLTENFMEGYHLPVAHKATVGGHFPVKDTRFPEQSHEAFTYQFFTKRASAPVGTAHPDNHRLEGEQRYTSILPTIFPSHMFSLAPDHFWYLSLQPLGSDQVKIRYGAALAPEVLAACDDKDKLIEDTCRFLDEVNAEDKIVVEGIGRGVKAPLSTAGPLCWLERENHDFIKYLASKLC